MKSNDEYNREGMKYFTRMQLEKRIVTEYYSILLIYDIKYGKMNLA